MLIDSNSTFGAIDPRVRLRTIAIKKLRLDFHPRRGLDGDTVAGYIAKFAERTPPDPVEVVFDGEDYYLARGFHRVAAAKSLGRKMVMADVRWGTRSDVEARRRGLG